jgi:hypothetical protein
MNMTRRTILTAPAALGLTAPAALGLIAPQALALIASTGLSASAKRSEAERPHHALLAGAWDEQHLAEALLPAEQWTPFPRYADRAAWEALPTDEKRNKIEAAERTLGKSWETVPATLLLEYKRNGNRSRYEAASFGRRNRLRDLALAECLEGRGRFLDDVLNGVWLLCEETWWGVPAHLGLQKAGTGLPDVEEPVVDLFAAETASLLAWVGWLLGDNLRKLSAIVPRRIAVEIEHRMLAPCRERNDFWWMGLDAGHPQQVNNWNPWINSNWLTCALFLEKAERRAAVVHKILRSLDQFLNVYPADGGCDEGPGYWNRAGASLFDCLDLLHSASGGKINAYADPLVREIGRYIYRAHVAGTYYINFADAPAKVDLAAATTYAYGRRIGDAKLSAQGAFALALQDRNDDEESMGRDLRTVFLSAEMRRGDTKPPLVGGAWLPGIEVLSARRREGSTAGLYLAAQGGHNAESHNHNDVGNFIVYADGLPAIIDLGPEAYTAKTFSAQRYEIWTMRSAYHNCPLIHGIEQSAGREFAARQVDYKLTQAGPHLTMDIGAAYPKEAGVEQWLRGWLLDREKNTITVDDKWSLRSEGRLELTLMAASEPRERDGALTIKERVRIEHDLAWTPVIEAIDIADERLRHAWGERVWRIRLTQHNAPARGQSQLRITQLG